MSDRRATEVVAGTFVRPRGSKVAYRRVVGRAAVGNLIRLWLEDPTRTDPVLLDVDINGMVDASNTGT